MRTTSAALLLSTIAWCGCTYPDSNDPRDPAIRDSVGITILDYSQVAGQPPTWQLDTIPTRSIGGGDGGPREQLYFVRDIVELPNGDLVVANGGSNELRWFDEDGTYVRTSGGSGEGPGEFRSLAGLTRLAPDSLLAYDSSLRRFQVFDSVGRFVRGFEFDQAEREVSAPQVIGVTDEGELLVRDLKLNAPEANEPGQVRLQFDILRYDADGRLLDSIASASAWEAFNPEPVNGITTSTLAVPFGFNTLLDAADGQIILGDTELHEIQAITLDGRLERILRPSETDPIPVSSAEIQAYMDRAVATVPPEFKQMFTDIYSQMPIPDAKPRIRWLKATRAGGLWIVGWPLAGGVQSEAVVYRGDWMVSGRLRLPADFEPFVVCSDRVIGVLTTDFGVEEVHEYRVERDR